MAVVEITVRAAEPTETEKIVALAGRALGWTAGEPNEALFRWKHEQNPFGASPQWVAVAGDRLAGFRTMLRWEFLDASGAVVRAARPVDTATDPEFQGRGIFKKLTMLAVDELTEAGTEFIFNTPNDQSRPGYLKMGWSEAGRVPIAARPTGLRSALRMASARTAAEKWSRASSAGRPAPEIFADDAVAAELQPLDAGTDPGFRTNRTPAYYRWRYGLPELHYRAVTLGRDPREGTAIFRLRGRGGAVEATVADLLLPDAGALAPLLKALRRAVDADYLLLAGPGQLRRGLLPIPGQGPLLTTRPLASLAPPLSRMHLSLADIELF
ncbi:MAG: GNAT family N-acetyltransferase [Acidimicrobiales bacterium]|nr:GNAT family N-acetyltransferase [Acidimicrobiales bacterium]